MYRNDIQILISQRMLVCVCGYCNSQFVYMCVYAHVVEFRCTYTITVEQYPHLSSLRKLVLVVAITIMVLELLNRYLHECKLRTCQNMRTVNLHRSRSPTNHQCFHCGNGELSPFD